MPGRGAGRSPGRSRAGNRAPPWLLAAHENDGFIEPGLALPAPQSVDPLEREAEMAEDTREQLVAGERVTKELAIPDDVCQAAAPAADASEAAGMFEEIVEVLIDVRTHQLPAGSDFLRVRGEQRLDQWV